MPFPGGAAGARSIRAWRADRGVPFSARAAALLAAFLAAADADGPAARHLGRALRAERRRARRNDLGYDLDRHAALARACGALDGRRRAGGSGRRAAAAALLAEPHLLGEL